MADKKFEGGAFGGLGYKPLGWDEYTPPAKNKTDNPFFSQPATGGPLQPIDQDTKDQLASAMTSWYKAGRPSGFKNVEEKTAQKMATGAEGGLQTLENMSFPGLNMNVLEQVPASTNVEDRRPGMSSKTFNKIASYNNAQPEAPVNQLDMITAGLRMPGGPTQPVLSVPASSRLYKQGDDPFAELIASKGTFDPIEFALGLLGGPRGRPFAGRTPPVAIDVQSPGAGGWAGKPTNYISDIMKGLAGKAANDPGVRPTAEIVPFRSNMSKGNIRNQTEDEVLAGIDKNWADLAKGSSFTEPTPQETAIQLIIGALKGKPSLRVVSDNTPKGSP